MRPNILPNLIIIKLRVKQLVQRKKEKALVDKSDIPDL